MAALYSGVGMLGELRMLARAGETLTKGNKVDEIQGNNLIPAWVLLKSCSLPSKFSKFGDMHYLVWKKVLRQAFAHHRGDAQKTLIQVTLIT